MNDIGEIELVDGRQEENQWDSISSLELTKVASSVNEKIALYTDRSIGCAGIVWEAALLLCYYLENMEVSCISEPVKILELGSGTGVVGMYAYSLYTELCERVILTDLPCAIPLLQQNIDDNFKLNSDSCRLIARELTWGDNIIPNEAMDVDLILISDCVYLESCFEPLLNTLNQLINHNSNVPKPKCIMSYKKRRRADKQFFIKLRKLFSVKQILSNAVYEQAVRDGLYLYEISAKH
ncbi:hypothetical protein MP228_007488 [Amoeboaphelidium protococcarum]|nr:hypothetical protein MP228_007488 [Amoeboaphelidium protococcarum]